MTTDKCLKPLFSGMLAGLFVGLAGLAYLLCLFYFGTTVGLVIGALIFPVGLWLICETKALLYTGKIGFISERSYTIPQYLLMLAGNSIAACLFGLLSFGLMFHNAEFITWVTNFASGRIISDFTSVVSLFAKAVFCGILVYIAVFQYQRSESVLGKFIGVLIPIFLFVFLGYRHCIADIFYFCIGQEASWCAPITILLTILGNSLGSIGFHFLMKYCTK